MGIQLLECATLIASGAANQFQSVGHGWTGDIDPVTVYALYRSGAGFNSHPSLELGTTRHSGYRG